MGVGEKKVHTKGNNLFSDCRNDIRSRDGHVESSTTSGSTPQSECRCSCLHLNSCSYLSDWRRRTISHYIYTMRDGHSLG
ncbi:hypothetical protein GBAR_LOCUS6740 [Geodia barretti]|uniref:Uncharacterized protein n=1 Tax=Geodia barretti TaxID=519541 RepID=A0AA35W6Q3_GEOBA|nr:hypothetical protein GBAR_LOCUS6740 [Geodia barretti]